MTTLRRIRMVPEDEYLAAEKDGQVRHKYVSDQIYAMTGGSVYHNRIAGNLFAALKSKTSQRGCDVFMADMKVKTEHDFYYPDLMVVCDPHRHRPVHKDQSPAHRRGHLAQHPCHRRAGKSPGVPESPQPPGIFACGTGPRRGAFDRAHRRKLGAGSTRPPMILSSCDLST